MSSIVDRITVFVFPLFLRGFSALPLSLRRGSVHLLLRGLYLILPNLNKVSYKNLALVFPEKSNAQHQELLKKSLWNLARALVDFTRIPELDNTWVREHVSFPAYEKILALRDQKKGVLFVTGHLGSFDMLLQIIAMMGFRGGFVARDLRLPKFNQWIEKYRGMHGAKTISRSGALKRMLALLKAGESIGILFDQNLTRKHAVFVDWFGKPAATTKAVGFAAIQVQCPVIVVSIRSLADDKYYIDAVEVELSDIYADSTLDREEAIKKITERTVKQYEKMVRSYPEGWFWMHRRWKTAPEGEAENFYK